MEGRQDYHNHAHAHAHTNSCAHPHHEGPNLFCEPLYLSMPGAKHKRGVSHFACKERGGERAATGLTGHTHMASSRPTKGLMRKYSKVVNKS